jgi:uncharacterized Zn-finger protein
MENLPSMDPADIDRHFQNSPVRCVYCGDLFRPEDDEAACMWCSRDEDD